jgi:hypothetical protein
MARGAPHRNDKNEAKKQKEQSKPPPNTERGSNEVEDARLSHRRGRQRKDRGNEKKKKRKAMIETQMQPVQQCSS